MQTYVDNAYGRFVKIVAEGRGMTEEAVRKIADGRIYDGQQAVSVGLVDEIGFPEDTLAAMQTDLGLKMPRFSAMMFPLLDLLLLG